MFDELQYNQDGTLTWRSANPKKAHCNGRIAGYAQVDRRGHVSLRLEYNGKTYMASHVVWHKHHASFPKHEIDHINGDTLDNRIENLRDVPTRMNQSNRITHRKGKLVGCSYDKRRGLWKAKIVVRGVEHWLGYHKTEADAHAAYMRAARELVPDEL